MPNRASWTIGGLATLLILCCDVARADVPPAPRNAAEVRDWYEQAVRAGNPKIMFLYAVRLERGIQVNADPKAAARWYREAAERGYLPAQMRLASLYAGGLGVPRNPTLAARWTRRAADNGSPRAAYNYAVMLENGTGVPRDLTAARGWHETAFAGGLREAALRIAYLAARGAKTESDRIDALAWCLLAGPMATGYHDLHDVLARGLTEGQITEAHEKAAAGR